MYKIFRPELILAASLLVTGPALGAGYLKLDDIKGETSDRQQAEPAAGAGVAGPDKVAPPARKTQAEARPRKGGNVEFEWKVEEGEK